jgi:hypothetical protein
VEIRAAWGIWVKIQKNVLETLVTKKVSLVLGPIRDYGS